MKMILALAAAAVAVTAAPADAKHWNKDNSQSNCKQWSNGRCIATRSFGQNRAQYVHQRNQARRQARLFATGQRVPRSYGYWTPYAQIPRNYVTQYDLNPNYRYINRGGYIYVVDPKTYAVERIISALTR